MVAEDATDRPGQAALTQTFALLVKKTGPFHVLCGEILWCGKTGLLLGTPAAVFVGTAPRQPTPAPTPFMHQLAIHIGAVDGSVIPRVNSTKSLSRRVVELS